MGQMNECVDLTKIALETNSRLWQTCESDGETVLRVTGNEKVDHIGGTVALIGHTRRNYTMRAEMRFLGHHLPQEKGGWLGFVMRARDTQNYELVWLMPNAEGEETAAYLAVAHGVVPWWTEAYASQKKGRAIIPLDMWFEARVDVTGGEFTLFVDNREVFRKKFSYCLSEGRPGLYVGTATDAAFRRIVVEDLP